MMHANAKKMQRFEIQYVIKKGVLQLSKNLDDWENEHLKKALKRLTVKNGVTKIGQGAFYQFEQLKYVTFPDTRLFIEDTAFSNTRLSSVRIPDSVICIGRNAFSNCDKLVKVVCGKSLVRIKADAFSSCKRLSYVGLSDGLKYIGDHAFSGCKSLRSISLSNIEYIGERAFEGCGLRTIVIPKTITTIKDNTFCDCNRLRIATILNSSMGNVCVGDNVFPDCTKIVRKE